MTISIWRYSHLTLAISSFVFILLASVTGIILAFEPILEQIQPYKMADLDTLSLSETITVFKDTYPEVIALEVDANEFVLASVITEEGESLSGYFNPQTAVFLGEKPEASTFFQFVTNLHRSLFLKSTGRFLVGFCSFLLFLISISGAVLVLQRQRGFKKFFAKIVNENFSQYWHVVLGRWSLIPIIIITVTGVYLSLEKFDVFPNIKSSHEVAYETIAATPVVLINNFPALQEVKLSELSSVEFPFSDDVEDYYTVELEDRALLVNQFTGEILSEVQSPLTSVLSRLSIQLHTGKGSIVWSLILAVATINILFFIYSGFVMTFKRRQSRIKNKFTKNSSTFVILVGSENGSTLVFANALKEQLMASGHSVFLSELNAYATYKNVEHVIVMTSTYGEGEAPVNATNFLNLLNTVPQDKSYSFSVVGFGSLAYPEFCKFAFDIDVSLQQQGKQQLLPVCTINDKSFSSFEQWVGLWSKAVGLTIVVPSSSLDVKPKHLKEFKVISVTASKDNPDDTFKIVLKPNKRLQFTSGDLLAIYPKNDYHERLYSIGKLHGALHLSVKLHAQGLGSGYLNALKKDAIFSARIIENKNFHFPKKSSRVVLIGNGTGVLPFLGMLDQNTKNIPTYLYCGLRNQQSYALYENELNASLANGHLAKLHLALSQEQGKVYVQDLLLRDVVFIFETLSMGGTLMICGSLAMYQGVQSVLRQLCEANKTDFESFRHLIKSDCY
ncbi:flavodoxin/nitric oxide synthase [Cellulophaga algicola DSM 14237]|uniref:NADPH--hemoprotein reductase n=1 Tax=Cellulophaga algicola (strain DSM 14237 / IC166 / ACAM 630) TaxID=688270 RepID=E6XEZ6_CELAD|nr:PepSY domain-containing protein [Cellulophaga algicola]ADV49218.1 flavodoxin/nitric oxide synthase [Cellulophaga algicola DSM 14237]